MHRRLLLALPALLLAKRAHAWIPPGEFLVGKMADKRKGLKTVQLTGIRTYLGRGFEGGKQDVAETIFGGPDGAWRVERKTPKGELIEVSDGTKRVAVVDGKAGMIENDPRDLSRILLLGGTPKEDLLRAIQNFGVRLDVVALGRLDGRIAWIVGAKEGDTASPQLWIDKDRNFPLLLDDPRTKASVRYEGWGESAGSGQIAARVSWKKSGNVIEELKVEAVKTNPKLSADLFKPEAPIPPAPTPKPSSTPKPAPTKKPTR